MPIPAGLARVVFDGRLKGGEIFQWGIWADGFTISNEDEANTTAQNEWLALTSSFGGLREILSSQSAYLGCKVYAYPNGGPRASYVGDYRATIAGSATGGMPDQAALVVTTLTGYSGRRRRGRIYLPADGVPLENTGQVGPTMLGDVADSMANYLNPGGTNPYVVLSQIAESAQALTGIRIDSRVDIQRRRASRQVIETSVSRP